MKENRDNKLVIIGLDGASPVLIDRWIDDLPNFRKIKENGISGNLKSTIPPFSCPAWNSFMTGKNPAKIGIFDFQVGIEQFNVSAYPAIANMTYQDSLTFWDFLSLSGKKVGVVNVPITYPPSELNGFMISGFLTPPDADDYTYPEDLLQEIKKCVSGYEPTEFVEMTAPELMRRKEEGFIDANYRGLENIMKITSYLMESKSWDVFISAFTPLDRMQHYFWHHMDENHPKYNPEEAKKYGRVLKDFYIEIDRIVGEMKARMDDNTNLIIMSDHGFGPAYGYFYINNFLREKGFLSIRKQGIFSKLTNKIMSGGKVILKLMAKSGILELPLIKDAILGEKSFIRKLTPNSIKIEHPYMRSRSFLDINWGESRVYSFGNNKIFVNLKGRESSGIVDRDEEYRQLIDNLKKTLMEVKNPLNGKPLFTGVYSKHEIYEGSHLEEAPDIIVMGNRISFKMGTGRGEIFEIPGLQSGDHRENGVLMMEGPDIKKGLNINADIMDLAPTALYMNRVAIPEDIDGKVIKEALTLKHDIKYQKPIPKDREVVKYSKEENKELQKRLEGLGYL